MKKKLTISVSFLISFAFILLLNGFINFDSKQFNAANYYLNGDSFNGNNRNDHEQIDQTGNWTLGSEVITSRYECGSAFYQNQSGSIAYLFFIGGNTNGFEALCPYCDRYNVNTDHWQRMANMPVSPYYCSGICTLKDSIFVNGGIYANPPSNVFMYRYDINANVWDQRPAAPVTSAWNKLISYQDSLIYSLGGFGSFGTNGVDSVFLYNTFTKSWRNASALPAPNCGFACARSGDTIVVICGGTSYITGQTNAVWRGIISQSDRSQIVWIASAPYPGTSRQRFNAAPWGCKGIICGPGSPSVYVTSNECYVYSPSANTWTQQQNVPLPTCAAAYGSFMFGSIRKYVVASGVASTPPYSIKETQIFTDTLCTLVGIEKNTEKPPTKYSLSQNYPNPFNPSTKINYQIPKSSFVRLMIFDVRGSKVNELVNGQQSPGNYSVEFDGANLSSGIYFYKLETNGFTETKKMILLK